MKRIFFCGLTMIAYLHAGKENTQLQVAYDRDQRESPATLREYSKVQKEKSADKNVDLMKRSGTKTNNKVSSRSPIDIATGKIVLVIIEHDNVTQSIEQRRNKCIEMFNKLSLKEKNNILEKGFFE